MQANIASGNIQLRVGKNKIAIQSDRVKQNMEKSKNIEIKYYQIDKMVPRAHS